MFYKKNSFKGKKRQSTIKLNVFDSNMDGSLDSSLKKANMPEVCYNFDCSNGVLQCAEGLEQGEFANMFSEYKKIEFPIGLLPLKCYYFKYYDYDYSMYRDRLIFYMDSGEMLEYHLRNVNDVPIYISNLSFDTPPIGICYKYNDNYCIIFSAKGETAKIYNGDVVTEIENAPDITSMCIHYERLFVTTGGESTSLYFSDDFDPTNWSISLNEAGFIDLQDDRGKLLKVVSFLDYLYIFREYGITRVTAFAEQTDYQVSNLHLSCGKIDERSISICGDRIIFLASDGFYSFNGISATKILQGYSNYIDTTYPLIKGRYHDGKLYFLTKLTNIDMDSCVIVYDVKNKDAHVLTDVNIIDIEVLEGEVNELAVLVDGKTTCYFLTNNGVFIDRVLKKAFKTGFSDFGVTAKNKIFHELSLFTSGNITIKVLSATDSQEFKLSGDSNVSQIVKPMLKGDRFCIEITCDSEECHVSEMQLVFNY